MKSKKGTELALTLIITVVLLLFAAAVLIFAFSESARDLISGTKECEKKGYECFPKCPPDYQQVFIGGECKGNEVCCVKLE